MKPWELLSASKPSRYIGGEINQIRKDPSEVDLRFGLCFPDTYEIGMSHLGMKILYHVLNRTDRVAAERIFMPWTDRMEAMRRAGEPLRGLESRTPLREFDVLGVSLLYELSYTNVLMMLALGGLPLRAARRDRDCPLVIGGGSTVFNPEPVAEFFDAFLIGDGEEAVVEIAQAALRAKREGLDKDAALRLLAGIEGVYVPAFFEPAYADGRLAGIAPRGDGPRRVRKRFLESLEDAPFPTDPVVPFAQAVHDRISIEVSRGCTQGCRYCQAGMTYRPVRERHPDTLRRIIGESIEKTGYETLSLLTLSIGDYSCLSPLIGRMVRECAPTRTAMSLPSLRIGTVDASHLQAVNSVRKTGVTIVPEAGTQRLREVINKRITQEEILASAADAFATGHDLIKTYFMIGQPTERWEDLAGIVELAGLISRSAGRKGMVHVSVSTFVPKSHTPFQWAAQIPLEESAERLDYLRKGVRQLGLKLKWQSPELSWLEGVFSRADRRLAAALEQAHRLGACMDGWGEKFDMARWREAFDRAGVDPTAAMHRERAFAEALPWDHIDSGVDKVFLWNDWQAALRGNRIEDCFTERCANCGVCDFDKVRNLAAADIRTVEAQPEPPVRAEAPAGAGWVRSAEAGGESGFAFRYRLVFERTGPMRFLSHLEWIGVFHRALRRARFPLKYTEGFHPNPKINFSNPLPTGVASLHEYCDVEAVSRINPAALIEDLNRVMPEGSRIREVLLFPKGKGSLMESFRGAHYRVAVEDLVAEGILDVGEIERRVEAFNRADRFPVTRERPGKEDKVIDLKQSLRRVGWEEDVQGRPLGFDAAFVEGGLSNPFQMMKAVLGISEEQSFRLGICKTETYLG